MKIDGGQAMSLVAMPAGPSPNPASTLWGKREASVPAVTVVPGEHGRGHFVFVFGERWAWFAKEPRAWAEVQNLQEFAQQVRYRSIVECAQRVVVTAADFSAEIGRAHV